MRTDPDNDLVAVADILKSAWGLSNSVLTFLPLGLDADAAVYRADRPAGPPLFVKVKRIADPGPGPAIATALRGSGITEVLAPIPTISGAPFARTGGTIVLVYPLVDGSDAVAAGLSESQWVAFGRALRRVHDAPVNAEWTAALAMDPCALPSIEQLEALISDLATTGASTGPGQAYADYLSRHEHQIADLLDRARALRTLVGARNLPQVLCHGDIHAANILIGTDEQIHLVDWDAPLLAPRERDLIFVLGSRIARDVLPQEERWFFSGYGQVDIDPDAIVLFRYERVLEDLVSYGRELLASTDLANPDAAFALRIIGTFFAPGGIATVAETVDLPT